MGWRLSRNADTEGKKHKNRYQTTSKEYSVIINLLTRCYEPARDYYTYNYSSSPPNHSILFVTSLCNFECETCFYWKNLNDTDNDLTLEEIKKNSNQIDGSLARDPYWNDPSLVILWNRIASFVINRNRTLTTFCEM